MVAMKSGNLEQKIALVDSAIALSGLFPDPLTYISQSASEKGIAQDYEYRGFRFPYCSHNNYFMFYEGTLEKRNPTQELEINLMLPRKKGQGARFCKSFSYFPYKNSLYDTKIHFSKSSVSSIGDFSHEINVRVRYVEVKHLESNDILVQTMNVYINQPIAGGFVLDKVRYEPLKPKGCNSLKNELSIEMHSPLDYRPYIDYILERFAGEPRRYWKKPLDKSESDELNELNSQTDKIIDRFLALLYSGDEFKQMHKLHDARLDVSRWPSLPRLNLGITEFHQCNPAELTDDDFVINAVPFYFTFLKSIMSAEEAEMEIAKRIQAYLIRGSFQHSLDDALKTVARLQNQLGTTAK